jgi:YD repeat-containing protein
LNPVTAPHVSGLMDTTRTITYTYDPLGRLTSANYADGNYFVYTYDAVGNRLTETTQLGTTNYTYESANRLATVNGVSYTWDNNGNLLNDGVSTYTYDHANRLKSVTMGSTTYTYAYNGLGDRGQPDSRRGDDPLHTGPERWTDTGALRRHEYLHVWLRTDRSI